MNTSAHRAGEQTVDVSFTSSEMSVRLRDGRTITVPLDWYPRLAAASASQLIAWKIAGAGYGIHWPELDEDISVEGLLRGEAAPKR